MKSFLLYAIGISAEIGVMMFAFLILWIMSEMDVLEIILISAIIAGIVSLPVFLEIENFIEENSKKGAGGNMVNKNNIVNLGGKFIMEFEYSHTAHKEKFYINHLEIKRISGAIDTMPVIVPQHLINTKVSWCGVPVVIGGSYRSYNKHYAERSELILVVLADSIEKMEVVEYNQNFISLCGYICKEPVYRETPKGRRITDLLIAINRPYGKRSDYIPCICWEENAESTKNFKIGDKVSVDGRLQSREYKKLISEGEYETRTAYEVSASKVGLIVEDENEN